MTWCSKCGAPNRVTAEVGQSRVEYACREQFVCALDGESTAAPSIIRYRIGVESCNADPVPTRPDPRRAGFYMGTGPTLLFDDLVGAQLSGPTGRDMLSLSISVYDQTADS